MKKTPTVWLQLAGENCFCSSPAVKTQNNKSPDNIRKPLHNKPHLKHDWIVKITGRLYGFYLPIFITTKKQRWKYCFSQFFSSLLGIFDDCLTHIELSTCECLQTFNELYKLYYYAYADVLDENTDIGLDKIYLHLTMYTRQVINSRFCIQLLCYRRSGSCAHRLSKI